MSEKEALPYCHTKKTNFLVKIWPNHGYRIAEWVKILVVLRLLRQLLLKETLVIIYITQYDTKNMLL